LDLNKDSILAALLFNSKDFCGNGSHFLRLTSPEMEIRLQSFRR